MLTHPMPNQSTFRLTRLATLAWVSHGLLLASPGAQSHALAQEPTHLATHVLDIAGVFTPAQLQMLDARLVAAEHSLDSQVVVLVARDTGREAIEPYSIRIARALKIGATRGGRGALITVALSEQRVRIEVGNGLSGMLTDELCKEILSTAATPLLAERRHYAAVDRSLDLILEAIARGPPRRQGHATDFEDDMTQFMLEHNQGVPLFALAGVLALWITLFRARRSAASCSFGLLAAGTIVISAEAMPPLWRLAYSLGIGLFMSAIVSWFLPADTIHDDDDSSPSWRSGTDSDTSDESNSDRGGSDDFGGGGASASW
jgi:uncharacterized protein